MASITVHVTLRPAWCQIDVSWIIFASLFWGIWDIDSRSHPKVIRCFFFCSVTHVINLFFFIEVPFSVLLCRSTIFLRSTLDTGCRSWRAKFKHSTHFKTLHFITFSFHETQLSVFCLNCLVSIIIITYYAVLE